MKLMDKLRQVLRNYIAQNELILSATLSNPRDRERIQKLRIRPVLRKEALSYQAERFVGTKAYHQNLSPDELPALIIEALASDFRQLELSAERHKLTVLVSRKGKLTIKEKEVMAQKRELALSHNKQKQYLLPQDEPVPFLVALGVQNTEGKVLKAKYDKFRQINRYLEFVRDVLPNLPKGEGQLNIIDFGCGKSYLTFALYYYLKIVNRYDIAVVGLDLKEDVIRKCSEAAEKYGYSNLTFRLGDINGFSCPFDVDMVITLHACDTATDYALFNAVTWNAGMIFSVPCCQHELNRQISTDTLSLLTRYGVVQERFCALMTDAIRANLLEYSGYNTQLLEFVDLEHTPKNILIRAIKNPGKSGDSRQKALEEARRAMSEFHVSPALYRLLIS